MSNANQPVDRDDPLRDRLATVFTATIATQYGELPLSRAMDAGDEHVFCDALIRLNQLGNEVEDLLVKDCRFEATLCFRRATKRGLPIYQSA
jgi:hypothetical protein